MIVSILILAAVSLERLAELVLARHNTAKLLERGAHEHAAGHYPMIVLLHGSWLAGLWLLAWNRQVEWGWLGLFALLQTLRAWVLLTLKGRWTTRIIIMPGESLVRRGPYRFLSHPNYLVVVGEIAVLPLAFGLNWFAAVFTLLNAAVLWVRIAAENTALAGLTDARRRA